MYNISNLLIFISSQSLENCFSYYDDIFLCLCYIFLCLFYILNVSITYSCVLITQSYVCVTYSYICIYLAELGNEY
jgi:hypothetical protein